MIRGEVCKVVHEVDREEVCEVVHEVDRGGGL